MLPSLHAPALPLPAADFAALSGSEAPVYLDSGATTLKPRRVVERIARFYGEENAPVHRGVYALSQRATDLYEEARRTIAAFVRVPAERLVFVKGTTDGLNLVARAWAEERLAPGDEILVSAQEHHSNFLPWQEAARRTGAAFRPMPLTALGTIDLEKTLDAITPATKLVALAHVSNVLGVENPVREIFARAREVGAVCVLDGAQSVPTRPVDFAALGADALAWSGHKMMGPTGIGALALSERLLAEMTLYQTGGGMVDQVALGGSTFLASAQRFEAGTPHAAGAVGLAEACDVLAEIGMENVAAYELEWGRRAVAAVRQIDGVRLVGPPGDAEAEGGIVAVQADGAHPLDLAVLLDAQGVLCRAGHHCAMPLHQHLGDGRSDAVATSLRASAYVYNSLADADRFAEALAFAVQTLRSRRQRVTPAVSEGR